MRTFILILASLFASIGFACGTPGVKYVRSRHAVPGAAGSAFSSGTTADATDSAVARARPWKRELSRFVNKNSFAGGRGVHGITDDSTTTDTVSDGNPKAMIDGTGSGYLKKIRELPSAVWGLTNPLVANGDDTVARNDAAEAGKDFVLYATGMEREAGIIEVPVAVSDGTYTVGNPVKMGGNLGPIFSVKPSIAASADQDSGNVIVPGFGCAVNYLRLVGGTSWTANSTINLCAEQSWSVKGSQYVSLKGYEEKTANVFAVQAVGGTGASAVAWIETHSQEVHWEQDGKNIPVGIVDIACKISTDGDNKGSLFCYILTKNKVSSLELGSKSAVAKHVATIPGYETGPSSIVFAPGKDSTLLVGSMNGQITMITVDDTNVDVFVVAPGNTVWSLSALAAVDNFVFAVARNSLFNPGANVTYSIYEVVVGSPSPVPVPILPSPIWNGSSPSPVPTLPSPIWNGSSPSPSPGGESTTHHDMSLFKKHPWVEWVLVSAGIVIFCAVGITIGIRSKAPSDPQTVDPRGAPLLSEQGPRI